LRVRATKAIFRNITFQPRQLTDPRELRALAHPVRLGLLEALAERGPLTATEAADHVGESPSSCSWHLRQLAKFGFVEEAGEAVGRRRPWRLTSHGLSFTVDDTQDPERQAAGRALERLFTDRYLDRAARGLQGRPGLPTAWQRATGTNQFLLHVTPQELEELNNEVLAVLSRYHDRLVDPARRPADARTIETVMFTYPRDDA
jgi:predicted ArsR family transcriptional regulator